jgi:hypothetical protein
MQTVTLVLITDRFLLLCNVVLKEKNVIFFLLLS